MWRTQTLKRPTCWQLGPTVHGFHMAAAEHDAGASDGVNDLTCSSLLSAHLSPCLGDHEAPASDASWQVRRVHRGASKTMVAVTTARAGTNKFD